MDIIAHGLWSVAAGKALNNKLSARKRQPLRAWALAWWGIFPDLFAFTAPWILILAGLFSGTISYSDIPGPDSVEPPAASTFPTSIFHLASTLYSMSHSVVIFGGIFFIVWALRRKPVWELGGWLLHILIDIPSHSYTFFPTPVLWPISGWEFTHGVSWAHPWFFAINYSLLALAFIALYLIPAIRKNGIKKINPRP